jgi:hypothetical protein
MQVMQAEALHSRNLLKMNVLAFEACWAKNKASDISWSSFIQLHSVWFHITLVIRFSVLNFVTVIFLGYLKMKISIPQWDQCESWDREELIYALNYLLPFILMINLLSQSIYSRIPLVRHAQDWTGAGWSNITDYNTVPILTQVLAGAKNKASDIKLVYLYSTIKMMHGSINIILSKQHLCIWMLSENTDKHKNIVLKSFGIVDTSLARKLRVPSLYVI